MVGYFYRVYRLPRQQEEYSNDLIDQLILIFLFLSLSFLAYRAYFQEPRDAVMKLYEGKEKSAEASLHSLKNTAEKLQEHLTSTNKEMEELLRSNPGLISGK